MSKKTILAALFALASVPAMAGGLLTNSNQNAAFLRNFAQEGQITLTSLYANPAGNTFLSNGWHVSLNSQTAIQQRNITTTFPYFAQNHNNEGYGTADYDVEAAKTHKFQGKAFAPVIPSISASYNRDKWSVSMHFALVGGGGKCEFDDGLGSFEAAYSALLPQLVTPALPSMLAPSIQQAYEAQGIPAAQAGAIATALSQTGQYDGYTLKSYMKGRSYYFGLQLGGGYKFTDNFAGYIGLRGIYATCNYNGFVNPTIYYSVPANATYQFPGTQGSAELSNYGIDLNCDQTGFGVSPIIGFDWEVNKHWNLAVKYEAPTVIKLKNKTELDMNETVAAQAQSVLGQFEDGKKVREDVPGMLAFGAQYSPIEKVRISAGFHEYFDKSAKKYENKQDKIDHNTWELNAGVEYDVCPLVTISASWQTTQYGLSDEYMNDLSFNNSNNSTGIGVRLHPSKRFNIDLGYMHTFYQDRTVVSQGGAKTDTYQRKNDVVGIGFNFAL